MSPQTYLRHRRTFEVGLWILLAAINCAGNAITANIDLANSGLDVPRWAPWSWEISSAISWLALIPLLVWFNRRFPLQPGDFRRSVPAHLLFTVPLSLLHVSGMVRCANWRTPPWAATTSSAAGSVAGSTVSSTST